MYIRVVRRNVILRPNEQKETTMDFKWRDLGTPENDIPLEPDDVIEVTTMRSATQPAAK